MMSQTLQQLVAALPEVYQVIYGHPEWDSQAARDCQPRLEVIGGVYDRLSRQLERPLRVLDLGCAQGFFSLSLAGKGATVTGIDFQAENIAVCRALAEEHPELAATFTQGRIEEVIEALEPNQYDLVLGLSVFHHIVHLHGLEQVKRWLTRLLDSVQLAIFELALQEEPLYWGPSQPADPRSLVDHCAFYHQIAAFDTHLSHINRPMLVVSNTHVLLDDICKRFNLWRNYPYRGAGEAHNGSRRYYFGDGFVCKLFDFTSPDNRVPAEVLTRNQVELCHEVTFLQHAPAGFTAPQLIAHGYDERQGWLVMSRLEGELLSDLLANHAAFNVDKVLEDVLQQAVALESVGRYHDDIRAWNVMFDGQRQQAMLVDYGSIGQVPQDCVWPHNIFQAFFIFVNELLIPGLAQAGAPRPALLSPFHLPQPYANWLYAFWQRPVVEWRFALLAELFARRDQLPSPAANESGFEAWLKAQELQLLEQAHRDADLYRRVEALDAGQASLSQRAAQADDQQALLQAKLDELQQQLRQIEEERLVSIEQQCRLLSVSQQQHEQALQSVTAHRAVAEKLNVPTLEAAQSLEDELNHLRQENARLARECQNYADMLQTVYRSRSWRMTGFYRYAGLQIKLLRQYGVLGRCKHLVKRLLKVAVNVAHRHPKLKNLAFRVLRVLGLYGLARRLYRRAYPLNHAPAAGNERLQQQIREQLMDPALVPPAVREIHRKIAK